MTRRPRAVRRAAGLAVAAGLCILTMTASSVSGTKWPGFCDAVTDSATIYTVPLESKPAYLAPRRDSTFRTPLVRIAADAGVTIPQISGGKWGAKSFQHYSKDQPWNSDGTRLMIDNTSLAPEQARFEA